MNMRCSNRCAKPVRPGASSFEPTWYQRLTATSGLPRSTCRITVSPVARTNVSNSIFTMRGAGGVLVSHETMPRLLAIAPRVGLGVVLAFALGLGLTSPRIARANGAFPDSFQLLLPADRPKQVVLATNFGLL